MFCSPDNAPLLSSQKRPHPNAAHPRPAKRRKRYKKIRMDVKRCVNTATEDTVLTQYLFRMTSVASA